jgi:hypothetical protein
MTIDHQSVPNEAVVKLGIHISGGCTHWREYVGMLISLWLFLFAAQPKEFFVAELKKLEQ